jgi:predicted site-specific integrase-resolvase
MGYILRLTSLNWYDKSIWLLKAVGIDTTLIRSAHACVFSDSTDLSRLAQLANVRKEEVAKLLYPPAKQRGAFSQLVFCHPIPKYMIKVNCPKVCPECLRESNYYRKIWDLLPVTACPIHECLLLDECPGCAKRLSWFRKHVSVCRCEQDWRTCPPVRVDETELTFVRRIYQLCDLECGSGGVAASDNNPLLKLNLEDLVTAVASIAGQYAGINEARGRQLATSRKSEELHRLFVKGFNAYEAWPDNFYEFLDWIRESSNKQRQSSESHKDFGKFPYVLRSALRSPTFDFIRLAFEEYLKSRWDGGVLLRWALRLTRDTFHQRKFISQKVAIRRLRISERLLYRFIKTGLLKVIIRSRRVNKQHLLEREEVEELRQQLELLLRAAEVSRRLGIGRVKVRDLVRQGCLRVCDKFSGSGYKDWRFTASSVDDLLHAIENKVVESPAASTSTPLSFRKALSKLTRFRVGVGEFVKALLDGEITPNGRCEKRGFNRFTFSEQHLGEFSERYKLGLSEASITIAEAAKLIGVNPGTVYLYIRKGLLSSRTLHAGTLSRLTTTVEAVDRFNATYVLAIGVARDIGTSTRFLNKCLTEEGIHPVVGRNVDGCAQYLYERSSLEKIDVADIVLKAKLSLEPRGKNYATISCEQVCQALEIENGELVRMIEDGRLKPCLEVPASDKRRASYVFRRVDVEQYRDERLGLTHLLSSVEAAEMLGETYGGFCGRWVQTGRLTPVTFKHLPNKHYFPREDVKKILRFKKDTVSSAEAAAILGITPITVFKLTRAGKLKAISGPHIDGYGWNRYSRKEVDRLLRSRLQRTARAAEGGVGS